MHSLCDTSRSHRAINSNLGSFDRKKGVLPGNIHGEMGRHTVCTKKLVGEINVDPFADPPLLSNDSVLWANMLNSMSSIIFWQCKAEKIGLLRKKITK